MTRFISRRKKRKLKRKLKRQHVSYKHSTLARKTHGVYVLYVLLVSRYSYRGHSRGGRRPTHVLCYNSSAPSCFRGADARRVTGRRRAWKRCTFILYIFCLLSEESGRRHGTNRCASPAVRVVDRLTFRENYLGAVHRIFAPRRALLYAASKTTLRVRHGCVYSLDSPPPPPSTKRLAEC